ncbi:MAG: SpoIVB peptidase, partial [Oscillospiraceae bacterium]|nr:SpoIVB peptidase [Oscillospiraceae bacterium]
YGIASCDIPGAAASVEYYYDAEIWESVILSDVGSGGAAEYEVEISRVYQNSGDNRFLLLTVTDEALLAATGGIVQGLRGRPILQYGKIVGAVTHVCVNE